jgi:hypothetical protein
MSFKQPTSQTCHTALVHFMQKWLSRFHRRHHFNKYKEIFICRCFVIVSSNSGMKLLNLNMELISVMPITS